MNTSEEIAKQFHRTYEMLAPLMGYKTRDASAVPWEDVPEINRTLMITVVDDLLMRRIIDVGTALGENSPG